MKKKKEEEFYRLLSYNKNGHVVIREAPLVQQLNHIFILPMVRQPPGSETLLVAPEVPQLQSVSLIFLLHRGANRVSID